MNLSRRNLSVQGLWVGLLSLLFLVLVHGVQFAHAQPEPQPQSGAPSPELAYLKQVNRWRPPTDPQLHFLLMGQFANAGRHLEGIAFFEDALKRFGPQLSDNQKAQYLLAIASLRAGHANDVFLLKRIGWVRDTMALLDDAKRLSTGRQMFVSRWMSGVVRAQLPAFLSQGDTALADLSWCVDHAALAPHRDWLREVHAKLADVHRARGDGAQAARHLALSGYTTESRPAIFTTPFGIHASAGGTFAPQAIREVVKDSVYVLSGYEFTEYYFVDLGRPARADRHRRRHAARLGARGLRGAEGGRAVTAPAHHRVGHPRALGPRGRALVLPQPESGRALHRPQQLPRRARHRRHGRPGRVAALLRRALSPRRRAQLQARRDGRPRHAAGDRRHALQPAAHARRRDRRRVAGAHARRRRAVRRRHPDAVFRRTVPARGQRRRAAGGDRSGARAQART